MTVGEIPSTFMYFWENRTLTSLPVFSSSLPSYFDQLSTNAREFPLVDMPAFSTLACSRFTCSDCFIMMMLNYCNPHC